MKITQFTIYQKPLLKARFQTGLTLIELMISMVVGLLLLAGVVTNFISTKDADQKRETISEMDANAQNALNIIRQTITHAGYPTIENIRLEKAFYTKEDGILTNPNCRNGKPRDKQKPGWNRRTRDLGRGDILTIVSLADNPCIAGKASCASSANVNPKALVYYDCTGGGAIRDARTVSCSTDLDVGMNDPTEAKIFSTFRLDKSKRMLMCDGSRGGSQALVDNIFAMQFLYGVKQDDGKTVYKRANAVEAKSQWGLVRSVQVALLIQSSRKNVLDQDSSTRKYTLLDYSVTTPKNDKRRLYRIYTSTINLENLNKEAI